ncbi:MAG: MBL fold metallo-hydrolase [Verrucomicrobiales bacterium]|nr:MBL fold metallo-hydrolase [Verrucomicrobiota bacterium JB025]
MIEDDFSYVLRKALAGNGMSAGDVAVRAAVAVEEVEGLLGGRFSAALAGKVGRVLGLGVKACEGHGDYEPAALELAGVRRVELPFGEDGVNVWLVECGGTRVMFDAGFEVGDLVDALGKVGMPDRVFVTHGHRDHVAGVEWLLGEGVPVFGAGLDGVRELAAGDVVECGGLVVRACGLDGHFSPALGFHVDGLERPVLVVGDALFAGSMGKCAGPAIYQLALRNLRGVLEGVADETVLLPGHGPGTTVGEERAGNPFLAG